MNEDVRSRIAPIMARSDNESDRLKSVCTALAGEWLWRMTDAEVAEIWGRRTEMSHWHAPLDPDCPEVRKFMDGLFGDPMTEAMGAPTDDIVLAFEGKHRGKCERCQEYGAANIEVEY